MYKSEVLSELKLNIDDKHGPSLILNGWEHIDYIEDVLCEIFNVEYEYRTSDEETNRYVLYFGLKANILKLEKALSAINAYHRETGGIYIAK